MGVNTVNHIFSGRLHGDDGQGSGGKKLRRCFQRALGESGFGSFPAPSRPGSTLYHRLDHHSLRRDGCTLLSLTVRK